MSPICTGCLKVKALTATVATRPRAMRPATVPPATSTCAMIQPPKMSPLWFESAGIGTTRSAGILPAGKTRPGGCAEALPIARLGLALGEVIERPAAERREAGAEDESGVDQVGVADDALGEHRLRLREVRLDERVDERLVVRARLALHGLVLLPAVDALAGLAAQLSERDLVQQDLRRVGLVAAGAFLGELLARVQADVEADRVGELDRTHRHAERLHGRVDGLGLLAFVQHAEGVLHVGPEHAVDEKAGRILDGQWQLVDLANERERVFYRSRV